MMNLRRAFDPMKHALAIAVALAVAFTFNTPKAARADAGEVIAAGIIGLAVYCGATGNCSAKRTGRGGGAGPRDAVGLYGQNAMLVQGGLRNLGYYSGPIDGVIGGGSRQAIRSYQAAIGASQTGVLTGTQINDLVAMSPSYVRYPAADPYLFTADLANDLDRNGVRQLQAALNQQGYAAGVVDGVFGQSSRSAVRSYKAAHGLPGEPVASRRLLARVMGWAPPEPAGKRILDARLGTAPETAVSTADAVGVPAPVLEPVAVVPGNDLSFDILGVRLGMSQAEVKAKLMAQLGGALMFDTADAASIGAAGAVTHAFLAVQPTWPDTSAEQIVTLFDDTRPDLGALAIFRLIRMPDGVDQATYEAQVLPAVLANYGGIGKLATEARWIGRAAARDEAKAATCGDPRVRVDTDVANAFESMWRAGGGPMFDGGLGQVAADCGEVLRVDYAGAVVRIGLWNSGALAHAAASAAAPEIKF